MQNGAKKKTRLKYMTILAPNVRPQFFDEVKLCMLKGTTNLPSQRI